VNLDYRLELSLWIALSIGLYAGVANFRWYVLRPGRWRFASWLKRWEKTWACEIIQEVAGLIFYLGIPYAALIRGVALPRWMGLSHLDWIGGTGRGVVLGFIFFLLFLLLHWYYFRSVKNTGVEIVNTMDSSGYPFFRLQNALFQEVHWAFYRSLPIIYLGDFYWGVLLGLPIIFLEWVLDPLWRKSLKEPGPAFTLITQGGLALVMSVIFLHTRNLALCFCIHWAIMEGLHIADRAWGKPT